MIPADLLKSFPAVITVCDEHGVITEMNDASAAKYAKDGGRALIGKSLFDCHPEPAAALLRELLANPRPNIYTVERRGVKKLIYQAPMYQDGRFTGILEMHLVLPPDMPNHVRTP